MGTVIGWDIGGAHLKGVRVEGGVVTGAIQLPSPLWQGLDTLDAAFLKARRSLGSNARHAATMTGELADIFATRSEGVQTLARVAAQSLDGDKLMIYAGPSGFVPIGRVRDHIGEIASANWHASARFVAGRLGHGLFVDMGSTTTDLVALVDGRSRRSRIYRCRAAGARRARLHRHGAQLPHVDRGARAFSRAIDAADERIFRQHGRCLSHPRRAAVWRRSAGDGRWPREDGRGLAGAAGENARPRRGRGLERGLDRGRPRLP